MDREVFRSAELTVGCGENRFSMQRGSFHYRMRLSERRNTECIAVDENENGFILTFVEAKRQEKIRLHVSEEEGKIRVVCEPESDHWNRFWLTFSADPDEHIYGCGETYSKFDLKGEKVRIFVAEHQNANRIGQKLIRERLLGKNPENTFKFSRYESYYAQPTFTSSARYFLHADLSAYSEFDFTDPKKTTLFTQEPPVFTVEKAETFPELSEKLGDLLGRQRTLPDWIYDGAILAIQQGTETIERKLEKAEKAGAKICGVWSQDWCGCRRTGFGYQVMWNWEWDRELYPDLDRKIPEWKARGIRFLGYINPFLALEKDLYRYAAEKGYCVKDKEGKDYLVTITTFPAAMIDFTNPEAYNWYKDIIRDNLIGLGMGGWMADFGEYLPVDCVLYSGEDPEKVHNLWPAIWAKMNREVIEECGKQDEVFFFTRAGHTGTVSASAMMWTGDQHVDWSVDDGLPSVIPATLSLAMSGYGITHSDAGGYTTVMQMTRPKGLLLRWEEMNVFSPLYRFHEGNQPTRNVQFDEDDELLAQLSKTSRMHAALKPYLQKLVRECAETGHPVMRPLFYHYDEQQAYTEKTEYLLGQDVLVAPIVKEGTFSRTVYLPKAETPWVHIFTGVEYEGGHHPTVEAPIGQPPVFVRKGSADEALILAAAKE